MNKSLSLSRYQYLEFEKIALGALAPLKGFMTSPEFESVVETMRLPAGEVFPLPVILDVSKEDALALSGVSVVNLIYDGVVVGELEPAGVFQCDKKAVAHKVYGTSDPAHPGVAYFLATKEFFVGGAVRLLQRARFEFSDYEFTPQEMRAYFQTQGWKTVVGFQTRNVPHRAHEYLLRCALEQADGLFVQPLVGFKKSGDYAPMAILKAYETLIQGFLPQNRVKLGILSTAMRYAGPREAVFHAIVRRNYGCTHFIVGRDHAGVGSYYAKYAAHDMVNRYNGDLGITILKFYGPFYCRRCAAIATERTCPHYQREPQEIQEISGTLMRQMLSGSGQVPSNLMRPEIVASLRGMPIFIEE
ncbi:MAG: sulfate adenylyltransferase [Elusimicrobia bacterium]|nr:sulfate adenylyltransferase [Elusimicrobiota bacterium]